MSLTSRDIGAIERRTHGLRYLIDTRDRNTIANALRVAAEQYRRDAVSNAGTTLADHFTRQADECDVLKEQVEP